MKEETFTREKMMEDKNYVPYCGHNLCSTSPRMVRNHNNDGCICPSCGWAFTFPEEFLDRYNKKWNILEEK